VDSTESKLAGPKAISRVEVSDLFGRYSFDLSLGPSEINGYSRIMVLYGDNGSGKTTLLQMLFHLLSPAAGRAHRTFLARTPFRRLHVSFVDGTSLLAERPAEDLVGPYSVTLGTSAGSQEVSLETAEDGAIKDQPGLDHLETFLRNLDLDVYLVSDDRRLNSDNVEMSDVEARYLTASGEVLRRIRSVRGAVDERDRNQDLRDAILRAQRSISDRVLGASNVGSASTDSIYADVLARLATPPLFGLHEQPASLDRLVSRVKDLATRSSESAQFGLTSALQADRFLTVLAQARAETHPALVSVLTPYLDALEARVEALEPIQQTLSSFVDSINSFYVDKQIRFTLRKGIEVIAEGGSQLAPESLSSGEKQVLLLLSNALFAWERSSLFMIDEPELSLNMKWQRRLIDALLACTRGADVQFLLATHSFELLSAYSDRVVHLMPVERRSAGAATD
jgi:energy-coupling factor transporter ATP-binding protein EcfA2